MRIVFLIFHKVFEPIMKGAPKKSTVQNISSEILTQRQQLITQLEAQLSYALPHEYKNFLLNYNPSSFLQHVCEVYDPQKELRPPRILYTFLIKAFLTLEPESADDLTKNWQHYKSIFSEEVLPIAYDAFRNLMCISIVTGKIYFARTDQLQSSRPVYLYPVADSFQEFMERLYRLGKFS